MDISVTEHGAHPFERLGGFCQYADAAYGSVKPVRNAHEDFARLVVPLCYECLVYVSKAFVPCLVALDYVSGVFVDDEQMIVLI